MASGRFGRRRGATNQNLTMLIASLLREQRQAEDRAAFDAWQNGGEYQGKPMTDERIIAYIKARRNGFTKDDPLWDQWNNNLIQTEFSIGEQKVGLRFKQGKASAGDVAAFYREQLKKIPKDSAFYRDVAGRAADWAKAASGAARAAGSSRAAAALQSRLDRINKRITDVGRLFEALTKEALRQGLIDPGQTILQADASDLQAWLDNGVAIGGRTVTYDDFRGAAVDQYKAYGEAVPIYKKKGWDTSGLYNNQQKALEGLSRVNVIDDRAKYESARDLWEKRVADANGDPFAIAKITEEYVKALNGIYRDALAPGGKRENDPEFLSALTNEVKALTTGKADGPTPFDLINGGEDDARTSAEQFGQLVNDVENVQSGAAYYGQAEYGGPMQVIPYPANAAIDPFGKMGLDDSVQKALVRVNGRVQAVYLKGQPVMGGVLIDPNGLPHNLSDVDGDLNDLLKQGWRIDPSDTPVGYVFNDPTTKKTTYGVVQGDGSMRFTAENPWASGIYNGGEGGVVVSDFTMSGNTPVPVPNTNIDPMTKANATPLPLGTTVSQDDLLRAMGNTSVQGLDAYKSQEYTDYLRQQREPERRFGPEQRPFDPGISPAQAALSGALLGIGAALGPMFNPAQPSTSASFSAPTPVGTPYQNANPFLPPAPPPTPKPTAPPKPKKPKDDKNVAAGVGIGAAAGAAGLAAIQSLTPPPPPPVPAPKPL